MRGGSYPHCEFLSEQERHVGLPPSHLVRRPRQGRHATVTRDGLRLVGVALLTAAAAAKSCGRGAISLREDDDIPNNRECESLDQSTS